MKFKNDSELIEVMPAVYSTGAGYLRVIRLKLKYNVKACNAGHETNLRPTNNKKPI